MSSYGTTASSPTSSHAPLHSYWLLAGGYFSLGLAAFQVSAIGWPARAVRYFGGPAELRTEKPIQYGLLCIAIGVIVAIFGLYALSGAGKFRRLPLLRTVLLFVAAVYLLRGLLVIPQTPIVLTHPDQVRFVVFSGIALCVGVIHLGGLVQLWRRGRPGEQPQILC